MLTVDDILEELDQEAESTRRIFERVPDDRLEWRPHEKSLTLGQLSMHIAMVPMAIARLSLHPFDVRTEIPRPGARSTADLLRVLDESLATAREVITAMGNDGLGAPWRLMNGEEEVMAIPRRALLRSILMNHWYHHRGQLTVYLRLLDVPVPGMYGDSADEKLPAFTSTEPWS